MWNTLRGYSKAAFSKDFVASLNVALLAFPQGMAYAYIAGVPLKYGLYGSAAAAIFGVLFAKSHFILLGPTNATSIMLFSAFVNLDIGAQEKLVLMPLLLVLVGAMLVIGAYLRVANLIHYVSRTVVIGYITAAAMLIMVGQLRNAMGFEIDKSSTTFLQILSQSVTNMPNFHWPTVLLGLLTLLSYCALSRYKRLPNVAVTLVLMTLVAWVMEAPLANWFRASGHPSLAQDLAGMRFLHWEDAGAWYLPRLDLGDMGRLAGTAQAIALLCVLEGISIGKSLAARTGARIDANQEMLAMGMANIGCGFFSGMPASGSLTRSVLNHNSGAVSPMSSLFAGLLCLFGALTLAPLVDHIPRAALAVLVMIIGFSLINRYHILMSLKATKSDAFVFLCTLGAGLLVPLDTAIYVGTALALILFLRKVSTPELCEYGMGQDGQLTKLKDGGQRDNPNISIVHVEGQLFFAASELFQDQLRRVCEDPNLKVVILKMRHALNLDATSVMALKELVVNMEEKDRSLLVSEVHGPVVGIFERTGLTEVLGSENIFLDDEQNPNLATARAIRRAKEIIGIKKTGVSIMAPGYS